MMKDNKNSMSGFILEQVLFIIAVIFTARLSRIICEKLAESNIISEGYVKLAACILFFVIIFAGFKIIENFKNRNSDPNLDEAEISEYEELELERKFKENAIYIIKPRIFTFDKVYKLIFKNNNFYFCKVGGQFYDINESAMDYSTDSDERLLLQNKNNFKLSISDIGNITLINKKSMHTGSIPNNGIVRIKMISERKTEKFIIHAVNEFKEVENYFNSIGKVRINYK